jgi:hypothetical protein
MEHAASPPELVRPWRIATLVATGIAGLELVLLILAGLVLLGKSLAPQVHAAAAREARSSNAAKKAAPAGKHVAARPAVAKLPRARTGVLVLNGNGVHGAAAEAAALVRARGYPVKDVGNAPRTGYPKTIVEYRPGFAGEAKRFARDLNFGLVAPLDGLKPAQLHGAKLVVILGNSR